MPLRPVALALAAAAGFACAAAAAPQPKHTALYADATPDISGLWEVTGGINFSPGGGLPEFTPKYAALYKVRQDAAASGRPLGDPTANCLPMGMPRNTIAPYPMEIMQTPGRVTILRELMSDVRRIWTDGRGHPEELDPTYNGHSIGRWEGDTLVVETVGLRGDTVLDFTGIPHSTSMTVVERLRRTAPDTLENEITLIDPEAYVRPWTVKRVMKLRPDWAVMEYVCQENNRNPIGPDGQTTVILSSGR